MTQTGSQRELGDAQTSRVRKKFAGGIYGQIVATATTLALAGDDLGAWALLVGVVGTVLVFWIAHAYAEILADQIGRDVPLKWHVVLRHLGNEWPIAQAAVPTAVALGLAAFGVWSRDTGVTLAVIFGIASLWVWGLVLARAAGESWPRSVGASVLSGGLGLLVVALKAVLH